MALTTPTNDLTGNTIASTYDQILFIDGAALTNSALFAVACQDGETALHVANDQILIKDSSGTDIASLFEVQDKDANVILSINGTNNRVGIGTDSPAGLLEISSTTADAPNVYITHESTGSAGGDLIFQNKDTNSELADDTVIGEIIFSGWNAAASAYQAGARITGRKDGFNDDADSSDMGCELAFYTTADNSSTSSQRMCILNSGNVGIGDTSPDAKLDVYSTANEGGLIVEMTHASYTNSAIYGNVTQSSSGNSNILRLRSASTDRMVVLDNGNVGIGDTSPDAPLCINQGAADTAILTFKSSDVAHGITDLVETDTYARFMKSGATQGGLLMIGYAETGTDRGVGIWAGVTDEDNTRSTSGRGGVEIVSSLKTSATIGDHAGDKNLVVIRNNATTRFIFDSDGDAHCDGTGGWDDYSDSRLKTDIETIPYGLAEVLALQPKRFKKASGFFDESGNVVLEDNAKVGIGFIAQDVKAILPELIKDIDETTSFYSMPYGKFVSVLTKAIQELSAKVTALENA